MQCYVQPAGAVTHRHMGLTETQVLVSPSVSLHKMWVSAPTMLSGEASFPSHPPHDPYLRDTR